MTIYIQKCIQKYYEKSPRSLSCKASAQVMHTQCRVTSGQGQSQVRLRLILCLMVAEN